MKLVSIAISIALLTVSPPSPARASSHWPHHRRPFSWSAYARRHERSGARWFDKSCADLDRLQIQDDGGQRNSHGRLRRSRLARAAFQCENACPSTGAPQGPCPGYIVDHITPLKEGGADLPSNMQWQTVEDAKAKDRVE